MRRFFASAIAVATLAAGGCAPAAKDPTSAENPLLGLQINDNLQPPQTPKRPQLIKQHDQQRIDNYAWLRDDNWQQVLRDPTVLQQDIRTHLEAETTYYEAATDHLQPLREALVREMRGRIKEDASTVPMRDGPFEYYTRFREGGQYPIYARRAEPGAAEQILFDGDAESGDAEFFDIGAVEVSPDHSLLAYSTDRTGSEYYDIRIRRIAGGEEFAATITSTRGAMVWAADSKSFFYIEADDAQRPKRVKHHRLGTDPKADRLVYEEPDDGMFLGIGETTSRAFLNIAVGNSVTAENYVIPLAAPLSAPRLIAPRLQGQLYDIDHRGEHFYIRTNAGGAVDFKVMRAPVDKPQRRHWQEWIEHIPGRYISAFIPFKDYHVRAERQQALPRIVIGNFTGSDRGNEHTIAFDEQAYALSLKGWAEFDTEQVRFSYESPSQPEQTFDYNMKTRQRLLRKTQEVPSGHNPDLYSVEVVTAKARDGAEIPVTVLRLKTTDLDGSAPLLLYGYGSYGAYIPDNFSTSILSLVDRGVIYALAHIRGGSAKGRQWYLDGKLDKKINSFTDFNDSALALIERGYTARGRIVSYGGSAGGLLVGAAANLDPGLYAGVLAAVPFVDVLNTISDASLPLTPPEWEEWGNPITNAEHYGWIAGYSPYDNIARGAGYPAILATGGLTDYRVTYWEPAKWIARLREEAAGGPFLLRMNMGAGHGGSAARFERMEERAHLYAFALDLMGREQTEPVSHR